MKEQQRRANKDTSRRSKGRKKKKGCLRFLIKTTALLLVMTGVVKITSKIVFEKTISKDAQARMEMLEATGEAYPKELLELAENNPEAMDFVLNYPKGKDKEYAKTVGNLKEGEIPLLLQWDERWGYAPYGSSMIAVTGCGPTCLSMVASGLTGDDTITPIIVAQYAEENGYYESGAGTAWSLMSSGAEAFGLLGEELSLTKNNIMASLENGSPIICSMRPGDFTTTGHFIVLVGTEEGKIKLHDPNSRAKSEKLWEYDTLAPQINNLWAFSLQGG